MTTVTSSWLQSIESLHEVPADQLQWLIDNSDHYVLAEGEFLFKPGSPTNATYFIRDGVLRIYFMQNNEMRELNRVGAGNITGYLPFSRGVKAGVFAEVIEEATIMSFPIAKSRELISKHFELTQALVHIMTTRVRDFTTFQQQDDSRVKLPRASGPRIGRKGPHQ